MDMEQDMEGTEEGMEEDTADMEGEHTGVEDMEVEGMVTEATEVEAMPTAAPTTAEEPSTSQPTAIAGTKEQASAVHTIVQQAEDEQAVHTIEGTIEVETELEAPVLQATIVRAPGAWTDGPTNERAARQVTAAGPPNQTALVGPSTVPVWAVSTP